MLVKGDENRRMLLELTPDQSTDKAGALQYLLQNGMDKLTHETKRMLLETYSKPTRKPRENKDDVKPNRKQV